MATNNRHTAWSSIIDSCQVNLRQAPQYAAVSSIGDTTPCYLQPPPIVEIRQVLDFAGNRRFPHDDTNDAEGQLLMHVALIDSISNVELPCYYPIIHTHNGNHSTTQEFATETQPSLSGCLVSSAYKVQAEAGARVKVCVFPEVRVWVCGVFKLKFTLFEKCGPVFTVLPKETYPGPLAPTKLSLTLATQGIRQRVYKQPLVRKQRKSLVRSHRTDEDAIIIVADDDDDDDDRPGLSKIHSVVDVDEPVIPPRPIHRKIRARGVAAAVGNTRPGPVARQRYATCTPASRPKTNPSSQSTLLSKKDKSELQAKQPTQERLAVVTPPTCYAETTSASSPASENSKRRESQWEVVSDDGARGSDYSPPGLPCGFSLLSKDDTTGTSDSTDDDDRHEASLAVVIRPREKRTSNEPVYPCGSAAMEQVNMVPPLAQGSGGKMSLCNLLL
ncbi:hypothetical protein QFC22_005005 [Naganishia vaughanmartiniae]|uniref:Uncharacterized protein n=1 Tax=Naganishia vaughanmartiniae TaxID=1424756 RepID=A0ACC2WWN7_9TREE|nr:hypothetical protein QFC22_005005 [Naganishia vaughanmartiniae]